MLNNRQILLGVTGGIAAYKAAELVRRLRDAGADVRVVMTRARPRFVTPLTFQALSGHPVHRELLDEAAEAAMGHIELARWADLRAGRPGQRRLHRAPRPRPGRRPADDAVPGHRSRRCWWRRP